MKYKDFYKELLNEVSERELDQINHKIESLKKKFDSEKRMAMLWTNPEYKSLIQKRDEIISELDEEDDELEPYEIQGEYWIQDGYAQFCDQSIGDDGHDSVAIREAQGLVLNYLGMDSDELERNYGRFDDLVEKGLIENEMEISEDHDIEEDFYNFIKDQFSEQEANKCRELYRIACDRTGTDARMYAKKNWGWITVHGNNIGVYKLDEKTIRSLIRGIEQILSESGADDILDEQVDLYIGQDIKSEYKNTDRNITLADLKDRFLGSGKTKADNVTKTDVADKLDKAIQHPFYKDRVDENYLIKNDDETRITSRFRHVTDPEEIDTIQRNYGYYAQKAGISETDLSNYISSGWGVVYKPYGSESATVGQFIGDVYAVSHYAPESDKEGIKMLLDLLHTSTPVVFAVPTKLSKQLERIGYKKEATGVPMYFKGELMEKDIMVNNAMRREDLASLLYHWMEESKNNHILSEHPKVKEFFSKLENLNNKKLNESKLLEDVEHNSALEFISKIVKESPYKGNVFLAGGAVRDMEMGKDPKDLDLVVKGSLNAGIEFAEWFTKKIGNYIEGSNPVVFPRFGTAKFNLSGVTQNGKDLSKIDVEVVATRKEKYTDGSRKPEVSDGDLSDDVHRRDFTVNSLLKDLTTGEILDLTGLGREDIKNGIVRTPLNPDVIFNEDPLRLLRAVRFAIKYNWKLPMNMIRAMTKNASKLDNISKERVKEELDKMLLTTNPHKAVKLMKSTGMLKYVIPELVPAIKMTQNRHHKYDVFDHTLDVLKKTEPNLVQRLMGLFHDIGKTVTRSVTPTGVHFYGHEDAGAEMAENIMKRLRYPVDIIKAVSIGVKNHMRLKHGGDQAVNLSDKSLRKFKAEVGEQLENVLGLIHADNIAHSEESSMPNQIANVRERLKNLEGQLVSNKPKLPVNGGDLMKIGIPSGPKMGEILSKITDAWYENPNLTKEDAIKIANEMK